jgi:hypothetical protein
MRSKILGPTVDAGVSDEVSNVISTIAALEAADEAIAIAVANVAKCGK